VVKVDAGYTLVPSTIILVSCELVGRGGLAGGAGGVGASHHPAAPAKGRRPPIIHDQKRKKRNKSMV